MTYKLGSLFDGSGGFPLSGALCGIEPVWAAEVEPYPIAVTRSRFPNMKHLGDISKVSGADIEPVDIITFGSPCQDLSVAGKRAGLKHEANGDEETTRSGLFMEAVRIIKEMRKATNGQYPRFALWENVPGAFSSNKGEDFRIVCEELIKIVEPSASMPSVPQNGWNYADSYVGDGWSLAYRVFDAQYWGVPQRRRRIHLVTDFRGECAREILFEREGLRGYFAEGRTPWQTTPTDAQGSTGADDRSGDTTGGRQLDAVGFINAIGGNAENSQVTDHAPTLTNGTAPGFQNAVAYTMKIRSGCDVDASGKAAGKGALIQEDKSATLSTVQDQYLFQPVATFCPETGGNDSSRSIAYQEEISPTLRAGATPALVKPIGVDIYNGLETGDKAATLTTQGGGTASGPSVLVPNPVCMATQQGGAEIRTDGKAPTLTAAAGMSGNNQPVICLQGNGIDRPVAYGLDRASFNQGQNAKFDFSVVEEQQPTLKARGPGGVCYSCDEKMGQTYAWEEQANTLAARDYKQPQAVCYAMQGFGDYKENEQSSGLKARDYKDATDLVLLSAPRYIVRRLTPTECARLQGFADWWGRIEPKKSLTDEEHQFWMDVRNTHANINGKRVQDYTKKQMLVWYNKLYTDSAEYKMWGNGIALPTALYVVQGMAEVLNRPVEEEDWML